MRVLPKNTLRSYYRVPTISIATTMHVTWRFFIGENMRWRWQQLATDRSVVAESPDSYEDYECCMAAARGQGYVFHAAQGRLVRPGNEGRFSRR